RHWILSVGIVCGVATPFLMPMAPTWRAPLRIAIDSPPEPLATPVASASLAQPATSGEASPVPAAASSPEKRITALQVLLWIWIAGTGVACITLVTGLARLSWLRSRARRVEEGMWPAV